MSAPDNFCVFILTHGRPDNQVTYRTLNRQGYTGPVYFIIDNEDSTANEYYARFSDQVIMFDKLAISQTFDEMDCFNIGRKSIVYARNACFEIAQKLGYTYFLQLDDDYTSFNFRFNERFEWSYSTVVSLDKLFHAVLKFYTETPISVLALAQAGDMIGGAANSRTNSIQSKRKAMNTLFCSIERPITFIGRINEDVNTYTSLGARGVIFLQIYTAAITQKLTQSQSGGMTNLYLDSGTYIKSFYTILAAPSSVKIAAMGLRNPRIHHKVKWEHTAPCILNPKYRKSDDI